MSSLAIEIVLALAALGSDAVLLRRRRQSRCAPDIDKAIAVAFGAQCPNCSARLSKQRGGACQKRRCLVCGSKFELS